jgi:hypothetical protein
MYSISTKKTNTFDLSYDRIRRNFKYFQKFKRGMGIRVNEKFTSRKRKKTPSI